jgi:hypothetical protein
VLTEVVPDLYLLQDADSWTGRRSRRTGFALRVPQAGVLALIDPPPLPAEACTHLQHLGPPTHIVLTCNWHLRGAEAHRRRWGCRLWLHQAGRRAAETAVDGTFQDGDVLWERVLVLHLPQFGWPEECALLVRRPAESAMAGSAALIIRDAVCGAREDIGVPEGEVGIYSTGHVTDRQAAHQALGALLRHPFDTLCFGHGAPVRRGARDALRRFLRRADLWGALAQEPGG